MGREDTINGSNTLQIKAIGVVISTFETLPVDARMVEGLSVLRGRSRGVDGVLKTGFRVMLTG